MFGSLGAPELIFILVLALLIFGPRKLPEIGRTLGKGLSEFRKASNDLKRSINAELIEEEMREADPRRMVREALAASPDRSGGRGRPPAETEAGPPTGDDESTRGSERPAEPPVRTVARGEADPSPSEDSEPASE